MKFELILPQRVIFGEGTVAQVGCHAERLGAQIAAIVTSEGMAKRECLGKVVDSLRDSGLESEIYSGVSPDPTVKNVLGCVSFAEGNLWNLIVGFDKSLIVGLGGGSVMDVAKRVATELDMPKIMVPTTAGSGSEVTHEVVFKANGKKRGVVDGRLAADVAIVDPDLLATLPQRAMVASAMDALSHAIESYQAKRRNIVTEGLAQRAIGLIRDGLYWGVDRLQETRFGLSMGSLLAGMAFGNSGTALCHALSYPLSNRGMPHAEAVAVMLPHMVKFNGCETGFDGILVAKLEEMASAVGIGIDFDCDVEEMANEVMEDERHLSNNPRKVGLEDVAKIYGEALGCVTAK